MAVRFPSTEFFQALQAQMSAERDRFRQLGYFDTNIGIRVLGDRLPGGRWEGVLRFEVFECLDVRQTDLSREKVDFTLEGDLPVWAEMLRNIESLRVILYVKVKLSLLLRSILSLNFDVCLIRALKSP